MKILLTGAPRSGKTTLLTNLIENIEPKYGMLAQEIIENGRRSGFQIIDSEGHQSILASVSKHTDYPVGRFFVDIDSLEASCARLFAIPAGLLLYIDEIGQMQLYSDRFKQLVTTFLDSDNDYLGTISAVYENPFIDQITSREDLLLCTITPDNRHILQEILAEAMRARIIFGTMTPAQREIVLKLARHYLHAERYISLKKLFHNALRYVAEHKVEAAENSYIIAGNHGLHTVQKTGEGYHCDCDFFNGRGQFIGMAGECSHIQAVKITANS